jgi:hypothetical protein
MPEDYLTRLKREEQEKEAFSQSITFSNKYMDWLDKCTQDNNTIATDSFLYKEDQVSQTDLQNAKSIQFLFEEVSTYCDENYIEPKKVDYGVYYSIKNNGIGYHVGFDTGQGASFYCTRLEEPDDDALDFKHVRSGVKLQKTLYDEYLLENLSILIKELYNAGVSINAIKKTVSSSIKTIENEQTTKRQK